MKKSLVIISFAFIFLLSISIVSANFWDLITGKVIQDDGWTQWFNGDTPTGNGDYELIDNIKKDYGICETPTGIECQTTDGKNYAETGEVVTCAVDKGVFCVNSVQPDGRCNYNYKVRFYCGALEIKPMKQIEKVEGEPLEIASDLKLTEPAIREPVPETPKIQKEIAPERTKSGNLFSRDSGAAAVTEEKKESAPEEENQIKFMEGVRLIEADSELIREIGETKKRLEEIDNNLLVLSDKSSEIRLFFLKRKGSNELKKFAEEREDIMAKLMIENPGFFLENAMPEIERALLPEKIKEDIEEEIILTGTFEWGHYHLSGGEGAIDKSFLKLPDGERLFLYSSYLGFPATSGEEVEIKGWKLGNQLLVSPGKENFKVSTDSKQTKTMQPEAPEVPKQPNIKVAVILFNFQNDQSETRTPAEIREAVFTGTQSARAYFEEISYGKVILEGVLDSQNGDVFGYYTIPDDNADCGSINSNVFGWLDSAENLASADGFNKAEYDQVIYLAPLTNCWFNGFATYFSGGTSLVFIDLKYPSLLIGGFNHELGHNFGTMHAGWLACRDEQGNPVPLSEDCTLNEYGDIFDNMGGSMALFKHMNSYRKHEIGFIPESDIVQVSQTGVYTLWAQELGSGVRGLIIPREFDNEGNIVDGSRTLTIEYRGRIPDSFDNFDYNDPVIHGISIRETETAPSYTSRPNWFSQLLDMTPNTPTLEDSALAVGETFNDPVSGASIYTASVNPYVSADVYIDMSNYELCIRRDPSVSITPESQVGEPGETLNYNLIITNDDELSCNPRLLEIGSFWIPNGLQVSIPQNSFSTSYPYSQVEMAPGTSITFPFSITSDLNSPLQANYPFGTGIIDHNTYTSYNDEAYYQISYPRAYWTTNPDGTGEITQITGSSNNEPTAYLVFENPPLNLPNVEGWEFSIVHDFYIKKFRGTLSGKKVIAEWTITQEDIDLATGMGPYEGWFYTSPVSSTGCSAISLNPISCEGGQKSCGDLDGTACNEVAGCSWQQVSQFASYCSGGNFDCSNVSADICYIAESAGCNVNNLCLQADTHVFCNQLSDCEWTGPVYYRSSPFLEINWGETQPPEKFAQER